MVGCFYIIPFYGAAVGFGIAASLGSIMWGGTWGFLSGVMCAIAGWYASLWVRRGLTHIIDWSTQRELDRCDNAELFERLQEEWYISDKIIGTLVRRGEPVARFRTYLLGLLRSEHAGVRCVGWRHLQSLFPDTASQLGDFSPLDPADLCRSRVDRLDGETPR